MSVAADTVIRGSSAAPRSPDVITVRDLCKRYVSGGWFGYRSSSSHTALQSVSFSVTEGEMVGLLGPNGAGKTTLLKTLSTLIEPDSGFVSVLGHDVVRHPRRVRGLLGLVTCDERSFYWRLTGRQNLTFFATLYGLSRLRTTERIGALLETLDMSAAADRPYHSYSSGMRQKLAIARGLLSNPRVVLYDEPTRSLDPLSAQNIRQWIVRSRREFPGTTHIIATNQLNEAELLCDRVFIISRGRIISEGSIPSIRKTFQGGAQLVHHIVCRNFRGHIESLCNSGMLDANEVPGTRPGERLFRVATRAEGDGLSSVLESILQSGATVVSCRTEQPSLDDIFCTLVQEERSR